MFSWVTKFHLYDRFAFTIVSVYQLRLEVKYIKYHSWLNRDKRSSYHFYVSISEALWVMKGGDSSEFSCLGGRVASFDGGASPSVKKDSELWID